MASNPERPRRLQPEVEGFAASGVPLYYQLATLLREQIDSGKYRPGDQLQTEQELVKAYGLSRMTVRQAVGSLEKDGLIRREPGRGTFVTDQLPKFSGDLELDRSIDDLISMGQATSVELLELSQIAATRDEVRDLEVVEGSKVIRCRRLRYFKEQPYCYIVNRLPEEIGGSIPEANWCRGSVLEYIEESLGVPLQIAKQRIRATLADANLARWLQVRVGAPLLLVDYHIRSDDDRPVETARLYYRSDLYSFTLHFTRSGEEKQGKSWALKGPRFEH